MFEELFKSIKENFTLSKNAEIGLANFFDSMENSNSKLAIKQM